MIEDLARLGLYVDSSGVVRATKELDKLERQGSRTERSTTKATGKMAAAFKKVGKAGALAAVAIGGLIATNAARDVANFTAALSDLSAITGAAGEDLEFYAENAKEIGRTTSLSASQAAAAFKLIASAKPDLLESSEALNQVTRDAVTLAEATGMELPAAAQALGSALNQFQIDASKSSEVINILAASSKLGTAEVEAVTEALRNAGPAANSLGIDLAETVSGIQALAKAGRQGADAGTGLRQVMLKLERTADATLQPSVVGLTGALEELASRNLTNNELLKIFGEEGFAAATALLSTRDTVNDLNDSLRGTQTAFEQANTRMDNLTGDTRELKSAIEGLSIELGERLEPMLRKATQGLTGMINEITKLVSGKASVSDLTKELEALENRLANSKFFGRSAAAQKSALRAEIEEVRRELALAKAEAGETSAIADLLADKREELARLEARTGGRRMRGGQNSPIAQLKAEIAELEAQLRESAPIIEQAQQTLSTGGVEDTGGDTATPTGSPKRAIEEGLKEAEPIDTSSLMWDWSPVRDEFKNELEAGMIDSQAIMDEWTPKLFEEFPNEAQSTANEMSEFATQAARNMQDAMAGGFFDIMRGNFDDLGDSFKATIDRMVADMLASQLMNFLTPASMGGKGGWFSSAAGSAGNSFFGGLADFLSFDGGGYTGSGARAGGLDGKGGMLAMIHPQETVVDHTKGQTINNGVTVNVNVSGMRDSADLRRSASQIAQQAGAAANRALARNS